jgi:hypothetical protein
MRRPDRSQIGIDMGNFFVKKDAHQHARNEYAPTEDCTLMVSLGDVFSFC